MAEVDPVLFLTVIDYARCHANEYLDSEDAEKFEKTLEQVESCELVSAETKKLLDTLLLDANEYEFREAAIALATHWDATRAVVKS